LREFIRKLPGVTSVRVNTYCGSLVIDYDQGRTNFNSELSGALENISFAWLDAQPLSVAGGERRNEKDNDQNFIDRCLCPIEPSGWPALALSSGAFVMSIACAGTLMPIALGLSGYCALPSFHRALNIMLNERRLNVDVLDSLAIGISTLYGNGVTSAFMTWLITLGDWIRDQTAARSKRAISGLLDYQKKRAWVKRGREKVSVRVSEIVPGDVVIVYDGEMIPVDGRVIKGRASIDQRAITGESMPAAKGRGDKVYAASLVHEGKLYLHAEKPASDSLAAQIVQMVESAPMGETRTQNYAEKFADRLVAPTLGAAGLLYGLSGDLNRTLSVLIVDFGTGIRVAAPTAILASISGAVRHGVLIRGGNRMERLSNVDAMVFDKTGTLTRGRPRVVDVISYKRGFPENEVLRVAASAEIRFKHPVAFATVAKAREQAIPLSPRTESKYHVGLGVEAQVNGYFVHLGSGRFLRNCGIDIGRGLSDSRAASSDGHSTLMMAVNGEMVGQLIYGDELRPESRGVVSALKQRRVRDLVMLTGDNEAAANQVASALGIKDVHAEILPHEKVEVIEELRRAGRTVAMVGDGINDAAALSRADVGIAMKNGTDLAQESAHVVLMHDDLNLVVTSVDIARNAVKLVEQNYAIVAGMNVIALGLSLVAGLAGPQVTALISNGSAVLASLNGLRPLITLN
jgi:Cu2+-exporting ATPase